MKNSSTRPLPPWGTRTALLLAALALAACSAVRFGYNHGEALTWWWLDGYIDAYAEQKPWIRQRIDAAFDWHRRTQLDDYTALLARTQKQVQHPVAKQELRGAYDDVRGRMRVIVDHLLPDLADLALALTPRQIDRIEEKFAAGNEKYRKDYLRGGLEDRQRFRFKKVMDQAEYWFGDFSREQEAAIRRASDARILDNEAWYAGRVHRQKTLLALLRRIQAEKPDREAAIAMLRAHADLVLEHGGGGAHEAYFLASRDGMLTLAATIINMATPEQRAHAVRRLQHWIDSFGALNRQRR